MYAGCLLLLEVYEVSVDEEHHIRPELSPFIAGRVKEIEGLLMY